VSTIQAALSVLGALVALAVLGGGLWAVFRNANLTATNDRQAKQITEYIGRIDYIEPRWKAADEQNTLLRELINPTAQLGRIESKTERAVELLEQQRQTLDELGQEMHRRGPRDGE
jgi:uncharacterized protein HemX